MTFRRQRDDSKPPAKKKTFETNIFKFFLERASNFCCATNQNNPRKYVRYDRSCLLQHCRKFFPCAPPIPLGNFYPLAPPPPTLGISTDNQWEGGIDIFWNHTIDLFGLYILFSQYRSCDNTQEVWSFVLFIKMRAFKHEYACMHSF